MDFRKKAGWRNERRNLLKKVICGAVLGISAFFTAIGFFSNIDSKKDFTHYSVRPPDRKILPCRKAAGRKKSGL